MEVKEGVWYLTREGRKAEVKVRGGISDVLIGGTKISTVFTDCGVNRRQDPSDYWDIVGLWVEKNADGTYKLPDHNIATCWRNDSGELICWSRASNTWNGPLDVAMFPPECRWLPLTEPTFPVRKKCSARLCMVRVIGVDSALAAWHDAEVRYPFKLVVNKSTKTYRADEVTVVRWLTPEYEDELPSA